MSIEQTRAHYEAMAVEAAAINDGGPAFPIPNLHHDEDFNGMTLRDYFAAKAMQGDCARNEWNKHDLEDLASWAYLVADAMLLAREVKA